MECPFKTLNNPVKAAQDERRKKSTVNSSKVRKPTQRDIKNSEKVNWSGLARMYHVVSNKGEFAKNGGQVVKEYLASKGVDVNRFKRKNRDESKKILTYKCERKK